MAEASDQTRLVQVGNSCQPCGPSCAACTSPTQCTTCEAPYQLDTSTGSCQLPPGGLCRDVNCEECRDAYFCNTCKPGFELVSELRLGGRGHKGALQGKSHVSCDSDRNWACLFVFADVLVSELLVTGACQRFAVLPSWLRRQPYGADLHPSAPEP